MTKRRPVEITFHAKQELAGLEIVASLYASHEFSGAAVEVVARNVQAAIGPRTTQVCAKIKALPIVQRRRNNRRSR